MVLHVTGGSGHSFLHPQFADELFGPGQPLDIGRYYIILPDNIGHGASSKPSDGLKMDFPDYDYADMIGAQRRMLVARLQVDRLRLMMGTSRGCLPGVMWGTRWPGFFSELFPSAWLPGGSSGPNQLLCRAV